jgi:DNA-binding NarL/FixJ family response regulator
MSISTVVRPITVSAIDDNRMFLDGLAAWLSGTRDLRLVHACATVAELLRDEPTTADVVLLEFGLRDGTDPVDNVRRLIGAGRRLLLLSRVAYRVRGLVRAGVNGFLTKDNDLETLALAIRDVAAGRTRYVKEPVSAPRTALSPREREVLLAYASGMTMYATARRVGVRPSTAKKYVERIKKKYTAAGRPTYTKLDLAIRIREDDLG